MFDLIASSSTYPGQSMGQWVSECFQISEIAIAYTELASLFVPQLQNIHIYAFKIVERSGTWGMANNYQDPGDVISEKLVS